MNRQVTRFLLVVLSYLLLACLFFYPFFQGKVLIFLDDLLHIGPMYSFWREQVLTGKFPAWNPYVFAGMPFLADTAHPVFSPFNVVFLLFQEILRGVTFLALVLVILASLGAYYLCRSFDLSHSASWLGGVLYGFSGSVIDTANDTNSLVNLALAPIALAFFLQDLKKKKYFSWKTSLGLGLMLVSGHTQYVYYELLLLFLALAISTRIWEFRPQFLKILFHFAATVLLGLGLAAIQIVPTGELLSLVNRNQNISYQDLKGVQVETLARFVLPRIYGTWVEGNSWGPNSSLERGLADTTGYVSYVGLIFAGLAVLMTRKISLPVIITGIVALSLILALGDSTPLFRFFYLFVPGFSFFRSTARILSVYTLGLAVLGAIGFDKLQRKKISQKTVRMGLAISPLFFLGVGGIDLLYHSSQLLSPLKETVLAVTEFSPSKVDEVINLGMQSLILVGAGILGGLLFLIFSQTKKRLIFVIASALLVVELFFSVRGSLVFAPVEKTHAPEEIIRFLTDNLGEMRFISTGEIEPYTGIWVYFNHLVTRPPFSQEKVTDEELVSWDYLSRELAMLPANTNQFYQLKSSAGYVALMPNSYREFLQSSRMNSLDYRSWKNPLLNEMSTKYLITGIPIDVLKDSQSDQFELTLQIGDARIYQNKAAKPRAEFLVGGQPTPAQIVFLADDPNRVVLEVQNEAVGALVLRDFLYPGWQAVVNGSKREITPFEQIFRSVPLDSGKNQVAFSYHPKSFYNGVWLSLTSLLLIVILALVEKRRSLL